MTKKPRTIPAGEFKAKCLALLDEVAKTGVAIVVTKRGRPVAKVLPADGQEPPSLRGSVLWQKDVISPVAEDWEANR